jgi:hypothetical protein
MKLGFLFLAVLLAFSAESKHGHWEMMAPNPCCKATVGECPCWVWDKAAKMTETVNLSPGQAMCRPGKDPKLAPCTAAQLNSIKTSIANKTAKHADETGNISPVMMPAVSPRP